MRVGTKLLLLAMLPVCGVVALAVASAVSDYRDAHRLSSYRARARLSFALAPLAADLEHERRAAVLVRVGPGAASDTLLATYERTTTQAFEQARAAAVRVAAPVDVVGSLDAARRQRRALVLQLDAGSLGPEQAIAGYSVIMQNVLSLAAALDGGAPSPASGRAAAAYGPILQTIESASRERVFVATLLATRGPRPQPTASPWPALETAELNTFRQNAAGPLVSDLDAVLFSPAGVAVQRFRDELAARPAAAIRGTSLQQWLAISGARIDALRGVAAAAGRNLVAVVSDELDSARTAAVRDVALSLGVLVLVTALALALRRSITGPLREVSAAARGLARGDVAARVDYSSRDEIGDVAAAFRDVDATADRLVDEIDAKNRAVRENRLDHRVDLGGLEGVWSQLAAGMNDTMAAFGELQDRQVHAERETARIFEMSIDLLCVIGFDGYFKRVNPAVERTLGYPREVLLSRPAVDFIHPDDRERSNEAYSALRRGEQFGQVENRNVCADGSARWLQWSARPVAEEGLIYLVGRDITESRRAAREEAALRRVATLVARGVARDVVFSAVAEEAGRLMSTDIAMIARYGPGPSATGIVGWRRDGNAIPLGKDVKLGGRNVASAVFSSASPARVDSYDAASGDVAGWAQGVGIRSSVGVPITVEGQLWGVMTVSSETDASLPPDTEDRLSGFTDLAATAIANAEARTELRHFADEQTGLRRVATLVARGVPPSMVFGAVAEEVGKVLPGVELALVGRYTPERSIEFVGGWSSFGEADWVGKTVTIGGRNVTTAVFETGQPARVDQLADDATAVTAVARGSGARSSAGAPVKVEGQLWGVMTVASSHEDALPVGIEHELAGFTELLATAIANADGRAQLVAARRRVIEATDAARARLARDIHDGAQQQFLTALIDLQLAQQKRSSDPGRSRELVDLAATQVETGVETLRELAAGVHPAILSDMGLKAALEALAARMPMPLSVDVDELELPKALESSVYFLCSEALANVVKHAKATTASVRVQPTDGQLTVEVRDDGVGGAEIGAGGSGLIGLRDRIGALDGTLTITSPRGENGTTLLARIPLPS